jgi:hypothetical protein
LFPFLYIFFYFFFDNFFLFRKRPVFALFDARQLCHKLALWNDVKDGSIAWLGLHLLLFVDACCSPTTIPSLFNQCVPEAKKKINDKKRKEERETATTTMLFNCLPFGPFLFGLRFATAALLLLFCATAFYIYMSVRTISFKQVASNVHVPSSIFGNKKMKKPLFSFIF